MKPINFEKKAAKNVTRVKMLIKSRLSWLSGYPQIEGDKLVWIISESGFCFDKAIDVDSNAISIAQRTVNTLYRDYPKALPSVVGDASVWYKRCCDYLNFTKELLHSGSNKLLSLFGQDSRYQNPLTRSLNHSSDVIAQLSWMHFIDRTDLIKSFSFLEKHQEIHNAIQSKDLINLIGLYRIDTKRNHCFVDFALSAITKDTTCFVNLELFSSYLSPTTIKSIKKRRMIFKPTKFPTTNNNEIIQNFIKDLSNLNKQKIKRALILFDHLSIKNIFLQWHDWWINIKPICQKIENHFRLSTDVNIEQIHALQDQLRHSFDHKPSDLSLYDTFFTCIEICKSKNISNALSNLLTTLKTKETLFPPGRFFLKLAHDLIRWENFKVTKISTYLLALNDFIKHVDQTNENFPWSKKPEYNWNNIDSFILESASITQIESFFKTLISLYLKGDIKLKTKELKTILNMDLVKFSPIEITQTLICFRLNKIEDNITNEVAKIAHELRLDGSEIVKLYKINEKLYETELYDDSLTQLLTVFKQLDALKLFKCLLFKMPISKIFKIDVLTRVISKNSGFKSIPLPPKVSQHFEEWICEYPKASRGSIASLNSLNSQSKKLVDSIFKNIWWTKSMIEKEIDSLKSIKCKQNPEYGDSIKKRISKFEQQLTKPKNITLEQIKKINQKLNVKIIQAIFSKWESQLQEQFLKDWCSIFKIDSSLAPDWLLNFQLVAKLLPILNFGSSSKNLAIKIINQRIKGPFYYIKSNPNNKEFIAKLKTGGINWPINFEEYTYVTKNGENVSINVESDPLEILDMGGHFGTCLSPGDMNYFSVFANIADVNKIVIYARNSQNKIVGRVLLGLTSQFGLQVFNRYTHHKDFEFHQHAQIFINKLAKNTGLIITNNGKVNPLCGSDWYDDGPENMKHDIECFNDDSSFRQKISAMIPQTFIKSLIEEIKPKKLNALIFSLLLNLPELKNNKDLFQPLLKLSLSLPHVANDDLMKLYHLANSYNLGTEIYSAHRKRLLNFLMKRINNHWYIYDDIEMIAEHHPSDALKMIKSHAKINKLNWKEDPVFEAIDATVTALKKLGRNKLAETITKKRNANRC